MHKKAIFQTKGKTFLRHVFNSRDKNERIGTGNTHKRIKHSNILQHLIWGKYKVRQKSRIK